MERDSLEYRVRRRAELRSHLGMLGIGRHVAEVDRAAQFQVLANHLALRVRGQRHALSRAEIACPPHPAIVRALALVAAREMQQQRISQQK